MTDDELEVFWAWLYRKWCVLTCWDKINDPPSPTIVIRVITSVIWCFGTAVAIMGSIWTGVGIDRHDLFSHWVEAVGIFAAFYPTIIAAYLVSFLLPNRTILALRGKKKTDPARATLATRIEANEAKALAPVHVHNPDDSWIIYDKR